MESQAERDLGKRVSFEEGERGDDESSSDDGDAVEVSFHSSNPYRRKSSLVTSSRSHISPNVIRRIQEEQSKSLLPQLSQQTKPQKKKSQQKKKTQQKKPECVVHQFLESHKLDLDSDETHQPQASEEVEVEDVSSSSGLNEIVDAKTTVPVDNPPQRRPGVGMWFHRLLPPRHTIRYGLGVRQLSRRLGSVRLKFKVRNIFLLTKIYDKDLIAKTREVVRWLLDCRARGG
ncbi:hypothetical protein B0T21DRAFT_451573 [Apiosordaria backusii]|uniref:Uncharacterized protein n=1 Tax=Apiosordaria backusii TaxID=314023 RepID=A0AA40BJM5_9PEZI|nr:hypothetical protein B0T21DRAFT_451573 [Apiosordaria backusii]